MCFQYVLTVGSLLLVLTIQHASAEDWNRFRGPNGSAVAEATDIPLTWSTTENMQWKVELPGSGSSCPVVWKGNVYLTCYSGAEESGDVSNMKRHLLCFDLKTGKELWRTTENARLPEDEYRGFMSEHGYATNTPVVNDSGIYVFWGKSGVFAFEFDGKKRWQADVGQESSSKHWGSSSSPILYKDLVIVVASDESESLRALDQKTGTEVWKKEASGFDLTFNTPILVNNGSTTELVLSVPNEVWSFDPETGKLNWYCEAGFDGNVSPSLVTAEGIVYGMGGRQGGGVAIRTGGKGDVTQSHRVWTNRLSSYVPSALLLDGRLYWVDDNGIAYCVNAANGELVYRERLPSAGSGRGASRPYYASVVASGNRIIATSRKSGVTVYEAGDAFKLLHQNTLEGDETDFNASPVIAGDRLLLRSNKALYCIGN